MKPSTHNKVEGTGKIIAGQVKEITGKTIGKPRLESEGKAEQTEGRLQKKLGKFEKALGS